jgi:hypothetical protein
MFFSAQQKQFSKAFAGPKAKPLGPEHFNLVVKEPWEKAHSTHNISEGFAKTGFFPATRSLFWEFKEKERLREVKHMSSETRAVADARLLVAARDATAAATSARVSPSAAAPMAPAFAGAVADSGVAPEQANHAGAAAEPAAVRRREEIWRVAGGATAPSVIDLVETTEATKVAKEQRQIARAAVAEEIGTERRLAGRILLDSLEAKPVPRLFPAELTREQCVQALTAAGKKGAKVSAKVAVLRDEVVSTLAARALAAQS